MVNHHDHPRNREDAPVLEVPKSVAYSKTDPQLLTITQTMQLSISLACGRNTTIATPARPPETLTALFE